MPFTGYDKISVLVLDDFEGFRSTVSSMLDTFGVSHVDTASNAEEALKLCKMRYYDAILSDFNLSKGRTGLQLLEELRYFKIIKNTQVFVLISAENSKQIVLAATDVEPDAYLSKPITAKALQQRLDRILSLRFELRELFEALDREDNSTAIEVCRQHISSGGYQSSLCQKYLGQLLIEESDLDGAEQLYASVLEVRPLEWAKIGMALVKQKRGELPTAERWFREIVNSNPLCLKAYDGLANVYRQLEDDENLQQALSDAVNVSPLALLRQQDLAKVASDNFDFVTAAKASRRVVRLAENSVYKSPDQNLDYARAALRAQEQDPKLASDLYRDALRKLDELDGDYIAEDQMVQSKLLQCQIYKQQKNEPNAQKCLTESNELLAQDSDASSFEVEVEMVRTLTALGDKGEANTMLEQMCERYKNDQDKLEVLDSLLEEPKSTKNKKLVAKINKEGIRHYQEKNYADAIESFNYAKRLFPNHVGVQLNLVQVALEEMEQYGCRDDLIALAGECLAKVASQIDPNNNQRHRYIKLQDLYRATTQRR